MLKNLRLKTKRIQKDLANSKFKKSLKETIGHSCYL